MKIEISEALIKKYLDRKCSDEEAKMVEAWYEQTGDLLSAEEMDDIRNDELLRHRMLRNIKMRSGLEIRSKQTIPLKKRLVNHSPSFRWWIGAAAIVLISFTYALLGGRLINLFGNKELVLVKNINKTMLKHQLPDGSMLWLAPQSSLQYAATFEEQVREITMQGDVFFEVAKDPKRPFIINSGALRTKVLGTSFRIRAAQGIAEEVSVVTGMVAVTHTKSAERTTEGTTKQEVLLTADQKVRFDNQEAQLVKTKETPRSSVRMWRKRSISFEDKPLGEITRILDSTFNVRIAFQDKSLESYTLTADFSQLNLISIMEIISQSLNLQYEISGDRIRLIKNN